MIIQVKVKEVLVDEKGGPGSGNFDHKGVEGQRGGSAPGGGSAPVSMEKVNATVDSQIEYLRSRYIDNEEGRTNGMPKIKTTLRTNPKKSHVRYLDDAIGFLIHHGGQNTSPTYIISEVDSF